MARKYAENYRPIKSEAGLLALTFSMLGNAYAQVAQYEEQEDSREEAKQRSDFERVFSDHVSNESKSYADRGREQMGL